VIEKTERSKQQNRLMRDVPSFHEGAQTGIEDNLHDGGIEQKRGGVWVHMVV